MIFALKITYVVLQTCLEPSKFSRLRRWYDISDIFMIWVKLAIKKIIYIYYFSGSSEKIIYIYYFFRNSQISDDKKIIYIYYFFLEKIIYIYYFFRKNNIEKSLIPGLLWSLTNLSSKDNNCVCFRVSSIIVRCSKDSLLSCWDS